MRPCRDRCRRSTGATRAGSTPNLFHVPSFYPFRFILFKEMDEVKKAALVHQPSQIDEHDEHDDFERQELMEILNFL